jgi:hypothetical protein
LHRAVSARRPIDRLAYGIRYPGHPERGSIGRLVAARHALDDLVGDGIGLVLQAIVGTPDQGLGLNRWRWSLARRCLGTGGMYRPRCPCR